MYWCFIFFTYFIFSSILYNEPGGQVLAPFYRWGNWSSERHRLSLKSQAPKCRASSWTCKSLYSRRYQLITRTETTTVRDNKIRRKSFIIFQFSSVQSLIRVRLFATPWIAAHQASLSIANSQSSLKLMSMSRWCHPAISSSVVPFSSCSQSLPASEYFPMSQLFTWGGQSTGVSALASFLPKNTQDWSRLERIGWISLQSKGLSRVFSNITVQKHQFLALGFL